MDRLQGVQGRRRAAPRPGGRPSGRRPSPTGRPPRPGPARSRRRPRPGGCRGPGPRRPGSSRASPARTAVASSNALWQVGRPRRRSSSSMLGRSSWIREYVWTISRAQAAGIAASRSAPQGLGRHQGQNRPEPLAAAKQAVPHRLGQPRRAGGRRAGVRAGQVGGQGSVHPTPRLPQVVGEAGLDGLDRLGCRHGANARVTDRSGASKGGTARHPCEIQVNPPETRGAPDRPPLLLTFEVRLSIRQSSKPGRLDAIKTSAQSQRTGQDRSSLRPIAWLPPDWP